jgi:type I restriction enzyme M protein
MSYEEFRRRIDTARNILVGAVPSPAGQIDQITFALMYKFLNDRDDISTSLPGGKRVYFVGEYEQYNWHKLMSSTLGAQERLELYRQAIQNMAKNDNIPELFRSIYQNAFLPFNSANVLNLFLKEIDKFDHGDSDDIGDAYEYLLSITGAQGDVGQFRTPRHIIKFIVEAVNPTKSDKVLDPAVGTAGFLIASYNHVKSQHDGKDEKGNNNTEVRLTADEQNKLFHNYRGFDIDPTMVRTSKVNLYLHGFPTPDIINHDSLSSEEYWNEWYDVILANPPFMTPKGGIEPHKKFGIVANRAEVLFVDYIASHLKPNGRAGIVVPEGVIFQSGKAYKELRKNLVKNYLYAVVSLPAGIFQPYSGVKTSILLLDKNLAKQRDEILFVKIENDGYGLGAQRRKVAGDQLPEALKVVDRFKNGEELQSQLAHAVSRSYIGENGDYNLNGDRYVTVALRENSVWPLVKLDDVVELTSGSRQKGGAILDGIPSIGGEQIDSKGYIRHEKMKYISEEHYHNMKSGKLEMGDVLIVKDGATTGKTGRWISSQDAAVNEHVYILRAKKEMVDHNYLYFIASGDEFQVKLQRYVKGIIGGISREILEIDIPLPPIEIQHKIVAKLDGYQKIIDAAQTIVKTYKPFIQIKSEQNTVPLSKLFKELETGVSVNSENRLKTVGEKGILKTSAVTYGFFNPKEHKAILKSELNRARVHPRADSIIISRMNTPLLVGASAYINESDDDLYLPDRLWQTVKANSDFSVKYVQLVISSPEYREKITAISGGTSGSMKNISKKIFLDLQIPLPPLDEQNKIVAELDGEAKIIKANKKLIEIFETKVKSTIAEVWGG